MEEHHGVSTSTMPAPHGASHMPPPPPPTRPKIRIIHIIAPEIIKTDVANFRDLVQRLTGKPACAPSTPAGMAATATARPPPPVQQEEKETTKKRPRPAPATTTERIDDFAVPQEPSKKRKIKCEVKVEEGGFGGYCSASDLWMDLNPGGFLSFLEEEADVFQGLAAADDFLLPLASSRLDWVGEMYAS